MRSSSFSIESLVQFGGTLAIFLKSAEGRLIYLRFFGVSAQLVVTDSFSKSESSLEIDISVLAYLRSVSSMLSLTHCTSLT